MLRFLLPLLFTIAIWATGRAISGCVVRGRRLESGATLLVGFSAVVLVLSWLSFVAKVGTLTGLKVVVPVMALVIALGWRHVTTTRWRDVALTTGVLVITYLHYLWPMVLHPDAELPLYFANDFTHYVAVSAWLQDHSILDPVSFGADYSTMLANVADHKGSKLRIGALLLMSLFASASGTDTPQAYAGYNSLVLALQAVAVSVLARRLAPSLPAWVAAVAGLLFGLCPTATWAAYASFIPQTLGLALLVTGVTLFVDLLDDLAARPVTWRAALLQAVPAGLLFFAAWSCYPEAVPLGALMILCYMAIAYGLKLRDGNVRLGLAQSVALVGGLAILLSPVNFWWGVQGMQLQVQVLGHGMEQRATPWTLFGMAVGAMEQPLYATAGTLEGPLSVVSLLACIAAFAGMACLVARKDRALLLAILVSGTVLFLYVMQRYSFARYGHQADWKALYTWNLFKAATYMTPFLLPWAFVGVVTLAQRLGRARAMHATAVAFAAALLAVAVRQDSWSAGKLVFVQLGPGMRPLLATLPPGRLLLDMYNTQEEADYFHRYALYPLLRHRRYVSTRDWLPHSIRVPTDPERVEFLREPFSYVVTDRDGAYPGAPMVAGIGRYRVLDVRQLDFAVELHEAGQPNLTVVNLAASPSGRIVSATLVGAAPGKVLYDPVDGMASMVEAPRGPPDAPVQLQFTATRHGGLRNLITGDAPEHALKVALRTDKVIPPPDVNMDLIAQITDGVISTDLAGNRMSVERSNGVVRLTLPRPGLSRAQLWADLEPGEYVLHLEVGQVHVKDKLAGGFGAFVGVENQREQTMEINPANGSHQYLRITATGEPTALALGFGAWGRAQGSMEIKMLEITRRTAKP
jgi:hypothetical protein